MNDNELYHYGVPGMKWGVRRAQKQLAELTGRDRSKVSAEEAERFRSDVKTARTIKNQAVREQWVKSNSPKGAAGQRYANAVLNQSGKKTASQVAKKTVGIGAAVAGAVALAPAIALGTHAAIDFSKWVWSLK